MYLTPQSYVVYQQDGTCTFGFAVINDKNSESFILGTSLFYNYNITFNQNQATVGFQGDLTVIQLIDFTFFKVTIALMLVTILLLLGYSIYLLVYLRVVKHEKYKKYSEISLSTRFLDSS